jgi:CBS-domain-containing membrane protein
MLVVSNAMQIVKSGVKPEATLREAAELMLKQGVDALPVMEGDRLVGTVRLADLLTAPLPANYGPKVSGLRDEAQLLETWRRLPVRNIMTEQFMALAEETPLMQAAALMINQGRQRLPVLRGKRLIGMVSRVDIVRALLTAEGRLGGEPASPDQS